MLVLILPETVLKGTIRFLNRSAFPAVAVVLLFLANGSSGHAQQTIINVPSDALTPQGMWFSLHESQVGWGSQAPKYTATNFLTYGLNENTELAMTLYNVDEWGSQDMALGLGFKSAFDVFHERLPEFEPKWTFGFLSPISLAGQSPSVGHFGFTHLTFGVPCTELRLLAGAAVGSENLFGKDAVSVLAGAEYPITEHLSFTGEWFSGDHNLSALIPGLTYHKNRLILVGGLKIPNDFDFDKAALVLEAGWFFGPMQETEHETNLPHYGTMTRN